MSFRSDNFQSQFPFLVGHKFLIYYCLLWFPKCILMKYVRFQLKIDLFSMIWCVFYRHKKFSQTDWEKFIFNFFKHTSLSFPEFSTEIWVSLLALFLIIRAQFFMLFFFAKIDRGNSPVSRRTPIFVVSGWTPKSCLRNLICKTFIGSFLSYKQIGNI